MQCLCSLWDRGVPRALSCSGGSRAAAVLSRCPVLLSSLLPRDQLLMLSQGDSGIAHGCAAPAPGRSDALLGRDGHGQGAPAPELAGLGLCSLPGWGFGLLPVMMGRKLLSAWQPGPSSVLLVHGPLCPEALVHLLCPQSAGRAVM